MCVSNGLTITGGVFQIGGFFLVSVDLYRLQRHEFGPLWFERALFASRRTVLSAWRRITKRTTTHQGAASLGMTASIGASNTRLRLEAGKKTLEESEPRRLVHPLNRAGDRDLPASATTWSIPTVPLDVSPVVGQHALNAHPEGDRAVPRHLSPAFGWGGSVA